MHVDTAVTQKEVQNFLRPSLRVSSCAVHTCRRRALFKCRVAQLETPHLGRNFLPSAAKALDVDKADRDMPGGWRKRQVRPSRKARCANVQKQVSATFSDSLNLDFSNFMEKLGTDSANKDNFMWLFGGSSFTSLARRLVERSQVVTVVIFAWELLITKAAYEMLAEARVQDHRKRDAWNMERTQTLKEKCNAFGPSSGRVSTCSAQWRTLHRMGSWLRCGTSTTRGIFLGLGMPAVACGVGVEVTSSISKIPAVRTPLAVRQVLEEGQDFQGCRLLPIVGESSVGLTCGESFVTVLSQKSGDGIGWHPRR